MPVSFEIFNKKMEQQVYDFADFDEDQEAIDFVDKDQNSLLLDICGCYTFAPFFAIDVM